MLQAKVSGDRQVLQVLGDLAARAGDLRPALSLIGARMVESTKQRFAQARRKNQAPTSLRLALSPTLSHKWEREKNRPSARTTLLTLAPMRASGCSMSNPTQREKPPRRLPPPPPPPPLPRLRLPPPPIMSMLVRMGSGWPAGAP